MSGDRITVTSGPATADERRAQMFPVLTPAQLEEVAVFGMQRTFRDGELLWNVGQRNTDFYVVLAGTLDVIRRDAFGQESVIVTHGSGSYAGETVMLSGRAAIFAGRAGAGLEALVLPIDKLKELIVMHAELGEIIIRSFILRRVRMIAEHASDTLVAGSRHTPATQQLLEFLTRNGHPYTFLCLDAASDMSELLQRFEIRAEDTPIVITSSGEPLRNPSLRELADRLGLSLQWDQETLYDLAVVGAGPAGLASAVYAASEGLDVVVLDPVAPGGQAGTSSRIENYLGFPTGISGQALAGRAHIQAQKFGAKFMVPAALRRLHCANPYHELELDSGERLRSRAVIVASGAKYRKPPLAELGRFEGAGIYYGATYLESQLCRDHEVAVIGGGNSAGQAAVFLSGTAKKVYVLVRSEGLAASMSKYLIRRIETAPNIELLSRSEVVELHGDARLEAIRWRNKRDSTQTTRPVQHLFVFIGATPNSDFVPESILTDSKGFICTGAEVVRPGSGAQWPLERAPFPLETSCPGIFAAGDVRATSTKRVASAVGEGSVAVQYVHQVLSASG